MSRRPIPTLADYAVVAISPLLIMLLVGSLVFFLIEVFYQGDYDGRLTFIMAMFVMGAVLIARIAIDRGREYAMLFAVPLGLVTCLATIRFVAFHGPLQGFSALINIGLVGLIWWCADKLTWDSTVIDESKDASAEGLLQTVGLAEGEQSNPESSPDAEATTTRSLAAPALSLWQKFVARRHRPHAPGVWIIYFSLAALPIFGFGNWFVPATDLDSRRYVFKLLVLYVASALGLLVTTSFLGLRRYLRQRRLEMPMEMAATWLGTGAVLIVGLLAACLILPRRNPEYSVTQLPMFAGSPTDLWTTEYSVGSEGQQDPERADRPGESSDEPAGSESSSTASSSGQSSSGQSSSGQSSSGQSSAGQSSGKNGRGSENSVSSDQEQSTAGNGSGRNHDGGHKSSANGKPSESRPSSGKGSSAKQQSSDPQSSAQRSARTAKEQSGERQSGERQSGERQSGERQSAEQKPAEQKPGERQSGEQKQSPREPWRSERQSTGRESSRRRFDLSKVPQALGGSIGQLLKLLYWGVVVLVVGYLAWRFRQEIARALASFLASWRALWESLFGRPAVETAPTDPAPVAGPAAQPFAAFRNPFSSGMAQRQAPEQVIRYSFEAFEAWGREHGCPRNTQQTPHEYASEVGRQRTELARGAAALAELYGRCAYGKDTASRTSLEPLRSLWEQLESPAA